MGRFGKRKFKGPETTYDKVKKIDPTFAGEVFAMRDDQLNAKLMEMAKYEVELDEAKKKDEDLKQKRSALTIASQTYTVPLRANKLKRQLIVETLKERGKA